MALKDLIKRKKIISKIGHPGANIELELPGDPLIYSVKMQVGKRHHSADFFRNKKFKNQLRCFFKAYMTDTIPVVVSAIFYVSPNSRGSAIEKKKLKGEKTPACHSDELCEYTLSMLEMLYMVLFSNYRQIVRIEVEKYYSENPRTILKFMRWEDYVRFKDKNTLRAKSKRFSATSADEILQSERPRNEETTPIRDS